MKRFLVRFVWMFGIVFVINAAVVWLWNLARHGQGAFDWETTLFFAVTLGVALPLAELLERRS